MSQPDRSSRFSLVAVLRRLRFPWSPVGTDEVRPNDPDRIERDRIRAQARVIRDAFKGEIGSAGPENGPLKDDADIRYFFRPGHALVRADRLGEVVDYLQRRGEDFRGEPERVSEPAPGAVLLRLPARTDNGDDVLTTLAEIEEEFGRPDNDDEPPIVAPDHLVYVTPTKGGMCPATEPEVPRTAQPWPPLRPDPAPTTDRKGRGKVRVAVVDTGMWMDAIDSPASPWLEGDDVFADLEDQEQVSSTHIHPYAGHGTFVAGVISCLAPETRIEVEGLLTHGGAIWESKIVEQLHQALEDGDNAQLISISAGSHTRWGLPPLSFAMLGLHHRLAERDDVLVIAAAGNDGSDEKFWPAAFRWAVGVGSVDPDGAVSDFSNVGENWVTVYARGRDLVNAFPIGTYTCHEPPNVKKVRKFAGLARWSGTSFSTPVITGLIAARMREAKESPRAAWAHVESTGFDRNDPRGGNIRIVGPLT